MAYLVSNSGYAFESDHPEYHPECRKVTKKEYIAARKEHARKVLMGYLKPGSKVFTKVNRVARSGMSRSISVYVPHDGEIVNVSAYVADLTDMRRDKNDLAVIAEGCGMDMGFQTVYLLGSYLWPHGTPEPHGTRNGEPDTAGGYALKQSWL